MSRLTRRFGLVAATFAVAVPLAIAARPTVTVPANMTVEAQSFAGTVVAYAASATVRDQPVPVTCNPPSGATFPFGDTTVSCTAADPEKPEDTQTEQFRITVVDTRPPSLTVRDKVLRTRSRGPIPVSFRPSAVDLVDGPVVPTCTPASGSLFPAGSTTVTCVAADRRGNSATAAFTVNVSIVRTAQRTALLSPANGALVGGPTMLQWRRVGKARFYNVQLHRKGVKILSRWPSRPQFLLRRSWQQNGRTFRLRPGVYTWFVWPAFGQAAAPRYGKLLGQSSFRVL